MRTVLVLLFAVAAQVFSKDVIRLHDGSPLVGREVVAENGKLVTEYLGVPFAEPPIGNLRFRKPIPKQPWRSLLNATSMPLACIQSEDTAFGDFEGATMWNANTPTSEDCLYLNMIVPGKVDPSKRLAVMIWIFGGGFWSGCATLDVYDGKIFASEENIIFVSMNYRVSAFGFLYLGREEAPGNMGLWDQLMAIKWVHKNIDLFGGNPDTVTLFGESAGAASVSMHMLSPKSTPYFQRAILQSGSATAPWALESREVAVARTVVLYHAMKCGNMSRDPAHWDLDRVLDCFMRADANTLRDNEWAPVREFVDFPWVPVVDGEFLLENAVTALKHGHFKTTELLAGSNLDESIYFIVYQLSDIFKPNVFFTKQDFVADRETWLNSIAGLLPRQMLKCSLALSAIIHEYEPARLPVQPQDWLGSLDKMLGDLQFTCNVNEMALAHSAHGGRTYYYYFTHRSTQQTWPSWMGVLHGYEINFIFGEPYNTRRFKYTKEEQELSSRFMRYWANFARTGNPNKNEDGTYTPDVWPEYESSRMEYMNLTIESDYSNGAHRIGTGPRRKQCAFWKNYLPNLMAAVSDVGDAYVSWRQQMEKWQNEYIVDWQFHFEQYKKYQSYRRQDLDQC